MDFAKKQMEKYGWTDGKGLGRYEDGIREALKPQLKRSTAGVGHDAAKDYTDHWWNKLYDKASGNIQVETTKNGKTKKITVKDPDAVELTNKTWSVKRKKLQNGETVAENDGYMEHFVRKAILTSGGAVTQRLDDDKSDNPYSDDEEKVVTDGKKSILQMTDEELFAACGGRTAHKGARHGLRATGKLARVQQQEALLLKDSRFNGYSHKAKISNANEIEEGKDKKKKIKNKDNIEITVEETNGGINEMNLEIESKKKEEKKYLNGINDIDIEDQSNFESISEGREKKSKKKKKKLEEKVEEHLNNDIFVEIKEKRSKRKKRKFEKDVEENGNGEFVEDDGILLEVPIEKEKYKNGSNDNKSIEVDTEDIDTNSLVVKKKKKKNKEIN